MVGSIPGAPTFATFSDKRGPEYPEISLLRVVAVPGWYACRTNPTAVAARAFEPPAPPATTRAEISTTTPVTSNTSRRTERNAGMDHSPFSETGIPGEERAPRGGRLTLDSPAGRKRPGGPDQAAGFLMMRASPWPPPPHSAAPPNSTPRRRISFARVNTSLAPLAPMG